MDFIPPLEGFSLVKKYVFGAVFLLAGAGSLVWAIARRNRRLRTLIAAGLFAFLGLVDWTEAAHRTRWASGWLGVAKLVASVGLIVWVVLVVRADKYGEGSPPSP